MHYPFDLGLKSSPHSGQNLTLEEIRALQLGQIARRVSDVLGVIDVGSKETFLGGGTETFFDEDVANPMTMNKTLITTIPIAAGCCSRSYVQKPNTSKTIPKTTCPRSIFPTPFNIILFRERRNRQPGTDLIANSP